MTGQLSESMVYRAFLPRLFSLVAVGVLFAFVYSLIMGNMSLSKSGGSRWRNPALIFDISPKYFDSDSNSFQVLSSSFRNSPSDIVIRSVYFDNRTRDGHSNATVFLLEVHSRIIDYDLISGCRVGDRDASSYQVRDCFLNSWLKRGVFESDHHTHWCTMIDCYDLPARNGSKASVLYKYHTPKHIKRGEWESLTHKVHRTVSVESTVIFPSLYDPRKINTKFDFTVAVCRGPVFGSPPLFSEWLRYQRTIGIDHIYLIVEESFIYENGLKIKEIAQGLEEGYLSYKVWKTPVGDVTSYYRSQLIATEDCLYRLQGVYDYVFVADSDDFFTPVTEHKLLHYYVDNWCHWNKTCGALNMRWIQRHTECGLKGDVPADGNVTSILASDVRNEFDIHGKVNYKTVHRLASAVDIRVHKHGVFLPGFSHVLLPLDKAYVSHVREHKVHEGTRCAQSFSGLNYSVRCVC